MNYYHAMFKFSEFLPNVIPLSQNSIQDPTLHLVFMSPYAPSITGLNQQCNRIN